MSNVPQDPPSSNGRKPISKKLRFEVFRRDGFRCRYCGANPIDAPLEVDHVIPVSAGGKNGIDNLVSACFPCNRGKAARPLDAPLRPLVDTKALREQAEQIVAFRAAAETVRAERESVYQSLAMMWRDKVHHDDDLFVSRLPNIVKQWPLSAIHRAIEAVGSHSDRLYGASSKIKYFYGVLRRMKEQGDV